MEDYPKTTIEFEQRFGTEEACLKYLAKSRWPDGFYCPRCGHKKACIAKRGVYRCKNCDYQVSVTSGTIFHGTRKPLQLWFHAIWYITSQKNGVSAMGLKQVLGLNRYETVWIWLHKLRRAMVRPGRDSLSGAVNHISYHRGRPERIRVDNGPEFISKVLDSWTYENNIKLEFSRPGKPTDNAFT